MFVSLDFETALIRPGLLTPRIVCASILPEGGEPELWHHADPGLENRIRGLLEDPEVSIVGTNIAFDFGCLLAKWPDMLGLVFRAYNEDRVYDIAIAQMLNAIAEGHLFKDPSTGQELGRYSLDKCCQIVLGRFDAKDRDFWRLRYALLENKPLAEWPDDALLYPLEDAKNTLDVCSAQLANGYKNMHDHGNQARAAWALHLSSAWGVRTDAEATERIAAQCDANRERDLARFQALGFYRADGTKDTIAIKRQVVEVYGDPFSSCAACDGKGYAHPITKTGKISTTKKTCKACQGTGLDLAGVPKTEKDGVSTARDTLIESGNEDLAAFALVSESEKLRTTYVPMLREGALAPINFRPNVLVESGRTSYEGLIQLIPRGGGIRECFVARPGRVFCSVDFSQLELCTLGQSMIWLVGDRTMADLINAGRDLHCATGATLLGVPYDDFFAQKDGAMKIYRQCAKAVNFGLPGGMGAPKFVFAQRNKNAGTTKAPDGREYVGLRFCIILDGAERCGEEMITEWKDRDCPRVCKRCALVVEQKLKPAWFRTFPGMRDYFKAVNEIVENTGQIQQFVSERVRGSVGFTQAANGFFQGLAADGGKKALWDVTSECYLTNKSPLYGSRPLFFVHDEIFSELPEATAHEAAARKTEIMIEAFRGYCPDVKVSAAPALSRRWYKAADPVYVDGRLVPWEPKVKEKAA